MAMLDFTTLYEERVEGIYRYHLALTGDPEAAENLTADTFYAALEEMVEYPPEDGAAAAWLAGIARRVGKDYRRRGVYLHGRPLGAEGGAGRSGQAALPPEEALRRLEVSRVSMALRRMAPDRAEALALYYFGGLDADEVSQAMRKSAEAARRLVRRGLADLRLYLLAARGDAG